MKVIYPIFSLLLFLLSCNEKVSDKAENSLYIISVKDSIRNAVALKSGVFYFTFFYGTYNFILPDDTGIFFYKAPDPWLKCVTGVDNSKPIQLYLQPDSLLQIDLASLDSFLNANIILSQETGNMKASISSAKDTIKNPAFKIITQHFQEIGLLRYAIRKWTEEEQYVAQAKLQNKPYNPDSINWKIGFDSSLIPPVPTDIEN